MINLLARIVRSLTPWYDEREANARQEHSRHEISRGKELSTRAESVLDSYVLVNAVYRRKGK